MTTPRRVYVYRGSLPGWLLLLAAVPLGALLLTSLLIAAVVAVAGAGIAALILPRLWQRTRRPGPDDAIELDRSQYRRIGRDREQ